MTKQAEYKMGYPQGDVISRSELIKEMCVEFYTELYYPRILHIIYSAPTVSERPQGEWILKETDCDDGGNNRYECSKCHYTDIHSDSADVPYCWHCGSIMKGGVI